MRLICPNCDAQYEVPDGVIPEAGRDVQCSNCGQTWFQDHPDHAPAPAADTTPEPDQDEEVAPAPPPTPDVVTREQPQRQELDPQVADILRQEAEIETRQRQQDSEILETQPDLGLDDQPEDEAEQRARAARERTARLRGRDAALPDGVSEAAATAAAVGSRRDLLPDIEEINSTLRSTNDRVATAPDAGTVEPVRKRRRGFRSGFFLILLIAILAIGLYILAPTIVSAVPALEPALAAYVSFIDGLRLWLDSQLQTVLLWLDQTASQSSAPTE